MTGGQTVSPQITFNYQFVLAPERRQWPESIAEPRHCNWTLNMLETHSSFVPLQFTRQLRWIGLNCDLSVHGVFI